MNKPASDSVQVDPVRGWAAAVLRACDIPEQAADDTSDCLVWAESRGITTHGLIRLRLYVDRLRSGGIAARPSMTFVRESGAVAVLDADNALGPAAGVLGMTRAVSMAAAQGVGVVSVRNGNHFGAASYYTAIATRQHQIGIAMSNVVASMPPTGGRRPVVGNNPIAFAFPAHEQPPVVFDAATSISSWGAAVVARQRNELLPPGAFVDGAGQPSRDPAAVLDGGSLLPIAGHKGYGLALVISLLTGALADSAHDLDIAHPYRDLGAHGDNSYLFLAIDVGHFRPAAGFEATVDDISDRIRSSPSDSATSTIQIPGEREARLEGVVRERGLSLSSDTISDLTALGQELGVPFVV